MKLQSTVFETEGEHDHSIASGRLDPTVVSTIELVFDSGITQPIAILERLKTKDLIIAKTSLSNFRARPKTLWPLHN